MRVVNTVLARTFAAGTLAGVAADLLGLFAFTAAGLPFGSAHFLAGAIGLAWAYWLNANQVQSPADKLRWIRAASVGLAAVLLRGGILAAGTGSATTLVVGALVLGGLNMLASAVYVFARVRWRVAAVGLLGYSVLLRLVYAGLPDLLPEEAYYWSYAMHPSYGYLDHPPMVGWLIRIGRTVFGDTALGVRIASLACWGVAAWFVHRLASEMFERATGLMALALFAALPYFLATGLLMTPDAPLVACWAGAVYFLWRALVGGRGSAWWGVGLALGLGMLSKYSIALLVPAMALFMVVDARARRWWRRPEPYLAGLVALAVFSPVILWNSRHGWASFTFQSVRRLVEPEAFALHHVLIAGVVMLTPLGAWAVVRGLVRPARSGVPLARDRQRMFVLILTLVPFSVFVWFSLKHEPQLNWTGPIWLATLPLLAASILRGGRKSRLLARSWELSLIGSVLVLGALLHFMALGWPGVPYRARNRMSVGWSEMSHEVAAVEARLAGESGARPVVVGMDHYFIAAEMAFYGAGHGRQATGGNLFGTDSLMFGWWTSPEEVLGRPVVLVSFDSAALSSPHLDAQLEGLGPIEAHLARRYGKVVTRFFTRTARRYAIGPESTMRSLTQCLDRFGVCDGHVRLMPRVR